MSGADEIYKERVKTNPFSLFSSNKFIISAQQLIKEK